MDDEPAARRSRQVAALFDRVAATYDAVGVPWFGPIADRLVAELAPQPGERALDVGCGRGAALFPLAEAVGPSGRVTGIDLSAGMVDATRVEVAARGLTGVDLAVMDASAPDLPAGGFDLIASSLVLFFLPDPGRALRHWADLLAPAGRIGVSTFGPRSQALERVDDLLVRHLPKATLDARSSGTTGPFGSDAGVADLLRTNGFGDVRTVTFPLDASFADADQWYAWTWSHGQRLMWESIAEADRPGVRATAEELLEGARTPDGRITLTQQIRLTLGRRAG